jgi:hypothetical protein
MIIIFFFFLFVFPVDRPSRFEHIFIGLHPVKPLFVAPMAAWNLDHTVLCCIPQETTLVLIKVDLIDNLIVHKVLFFNTFFSFTKRNIFAIFIQKKDEQLENSEQQSASRCGAVTNMVGPVYERSTEHSIT